MLYLDKKNKKNYSVYSIYLNGDLSVYSFGTYVRLATYNTNFNNTFRV